MNKSKLTSASQDPRNPSYKFKDMENEEVENSNKFNEYVNKNKVIKIFSGTLWAEGPAFIPHLNTLIWSDIPNN